MAKISKNILIPVIGIVLFAAVAAGVYYKVPVKFRAMKAEAAAQKAIDYVNKNMLTEGIKAEYKDVKDENGVYAFKLAVQGKDYDAYVTKNGALFFAEGIPQAIQLDKSLGEEAAANAEITKTDKPDVKVFVMSYCPYGLQAQKMYLPVYDLLKDKATMGIYFVNYAMHGKKEMDENLRQYCIQKDQSDKLSAYLKCFTASKTSADGTADFGACLKTAGVDNGKLNTCIVASDKEFNVTADFNDKSKWVSGQFPKFEVNNDLNEKYGVQGSPTIVINDKDVSESITTRSPETLKQVICSAFNNQPEECKTTLSSDAPGTGFGTAAAASTDSSGGCGG